MLHFFNLLQPLVNLIFHPLNRLIHLILDLINKRFLELNANHFFYFFSQFFSFFLSSCFLFWSLLLSFSGVFIIFSWCITFLSCITLSFISLTHHNDILRLIINLVLFKMVDSILKFIKRLKKLEVVYLI